MVLSFLKVDLSNYVKEANKYGNVIENIIEEEQDSSLLEVWKRERRLKIIYGGNVCGFNHFLINAMYGDVEREKLVQDLINYHAQNVIPLVLQQLAIVNQQKDGNSRRQRKKEVVLKDPPLVRLLANTKWESSKELFQNVSLVKDEFRKNSKMAIRVSALKGINHSERQVLFKEFYPTTSRFLTATSAWDWFRRSDKKDGLKYGDFVEERCIVFPIKNCIDK